MRKGTSMVDATSPAGDVAGKRGIQNSARYINIWKKTDGDWKLFKAIDLAKL